MLSYSFPPPFFVPIEYLLYNSLCLFSLRFHTSRFCHPSFFTFSVLCYKLQNIRTSVLTAKARRKRSAADHLESAATLAVHHVAGVEAAAVVAAAATKNLR